MADPELRRRSQSRATRRTAPVPQLPFAPVHYRLPPLEPLSADQVEAIHTQALMVLAVIGMRVLEPAARAHYARAGAEIDAADLRVRFPPGMIEPLIALAPATFMLAARDPAHNLIVGGDSAIFASVGGPAFVMDLDRGRRSGCMAEVED